MEMCMRIKALERKEDREGGKKEGGGKGEKKGEERGREGRERAFLALQPGPDSQHAGGKTETREFSFLGIEFIKQRLISIYYVSGLHEVLKCVSLSTLIYKNSYILI